MPSAKRPSSTPPSGDLRRASGLAARRAPFPPGRSAGRGHAGRALRPRRARAFGRQLPADPVVRVDDKARRASIRANFEAANHDALSDYVGERVALYARLKLAGLSDAPIQLAVFCDEATGQGHGLGARTMPETRRYSTVCALYTFWLAARVRGLGLGWVSILDPETIAEALGVPRAWTFIAYLCVGFPREEHLIRSSSAPAGRPARRIRCRGGRSVVAYAP